MYILLTKSSVELPQDQDGSWNLVVCSTWVKRSLAIANGKATTVPRKGPSWSQKGYIEGRSNDFDARRLIYIISGVDRQCCLSDRHTDEAVLLQYLLEFRLPGIPLRDRSDQPCLLVLVWILARKKPASWSCVQQSARCAWPLIYLRCQEAQADQLRSSSDISC